MSEENNKSNSYRHVLKYTSVFGGAQGLNILIGLVRNKCVAIILGPSGMGLMSLLNTASTFISQATNLGISFSAIRRTSEIYDSGDSKSLLDYISVIRTWSAVAAALGALACLCLGPLLDMLSFSWGNHVHHFVLLTPAVAMTALAGGELAILKGTRRLKELVGLQIVSAVLSLLLAVPLFWLFNYKAIVPVISLMALVNFLPALYVSMLHYPYHTRWSRESLAKGIPIVKMGVAFTVAAAVASGGDMLVRALLSQYVGLDAVGLFNAAYMITITYSGLVFSSMENDYFPRLSAVNTDNGLVAEVVNRQVEVTLLLMSPLLCLLITTLPIAIPLLFSGEFLPVVPMAQTLSLALCFKAVTLPMAYVNLAKGHSRAYMLLECGYSVLFMLGTYISVVWYGLDGIGWAIVIVHAIETLALYVYLRRRFGVSLSAQSLWGMATILLLAAVTFLSCRLAEGWLSWAIGLAMSAVAFLLSFRSLRNKCKAYTFTCVFRLKSWHYYNIMCTFAAEKRKL